MNKGRFFLILFIIALNLSGCGRSKQTQFYLLTPLPPQQHKQHYNQLQIGIDRVDIPDSIKKPQIMINQSPHHATLEELNQWASALDKNITLVLATNLSTLIPGAIVQSAPWDNKFHPDYHLQVAIEQFEIDMHRNSILRAEYIIYQKEQLLRKSSVYYHTKAPAEDIETLVVSMNKNLTSLTQEIAQVLVRNK